VDSCPTDVIAKSEADGKVYVAHLDDCQACFLCVIDCPVDAISLKQVRVPLEEIGVAWRDVGVQSSAGVAT
jgi:Fe-S-cluster-containing hydrogenase component 2